MGDPWKRKFLLEATIFRGRTVSFREGKNKFTFLHEVPTTLTYPWHNCCKLIFPWQENFEGPISYAIMNDFVAGTGENLV